MSDETDKSRWWACDCVCDWRCEARSRTELHRLVAVHTDYCPREPQLIAARPVGVGHTDGSDASGTTP